MTEQQIERRTKRRYAHELHPGTEETRPLAAELPHLYARAMGFEVDGTGWYDLLSGDTDQSRVASNRILQLLDARRIAFLADALAQGLAGDAAWAWADQYASDEDGELAWERAEHYGVRPQAIKPYPCGPVPDEHEHYSNQEERYGVVTRVPGPEDACPDCTEPIEETP